jgi:hypothetical protein
MVLAMRRRLLVLCASLAAAGCVTSTGGAPYEQSYLFARHNWAFRRWYPDADGLLNAFDYGHAALYQTLIADQGAPAALEGREYEFITRRLLPKPPAVPLDESAIGPEFAKLAPEVLAMFDWAHMLHRQLYDIWSAPNLSDGDRLKASARMVDYYRSRHDLAFSAKPKSMALMEGQPYSLAFRKAAPKFNGLLWSYHWFQLALQETLMSARTAADRRRGVDSVKREFFAMLVDAPSHMPSEMPMGPGVSPSFSAKIPDAAVIFDNLHALHDVVSDILISSSIPRDDKRAALLRAAAAYRDDTTSVISMAEWRAMAAMMGHSR